MAPDPLPDSLTCSDGPGAFNFQQGNTSLNPFWTAVRNLIAKPSPEEIACQHPKPILLPTGETHLPYAWQPSIVPLQIFLIGNYALLGVPSEFTTMSGRILRSRVRAALIANGAPDDTVVIIAGLSNTYSSYTATNAEYQAQRYEAASTIYGPWQLEAYTTQFEHLAAAIAKDAGGPSYPAGPTPPDLSSKQLSFLPGVIVDGHPIGTDFGAVLKQPSTSAYGVNDTVAVKFQSSNPRSHPRGETYLTVEKQDGSTWSVVATDGSWETTYQWSRPSALSDHSFADITWTVPPTATAGTYRIRHLNTYKTLFGDHKSFSGTTNTFTVVV